MLQPIPDDRAAPLDIVEFVALNILGRRCCAEDDCLVWTRACEVERGEELDYAEYRQLHGRSFEEWVR